MAQDVSEAGNAVRDEVLSRRAALTRLGLGAAIAYSAPVVLHIDRSANAHVLPTPCPPRGKGKGLGPRHCRDNDHRPHRHDDDDHAHRSRDGDRDGRRRSGGSESNRD